MKLLKLVPDDTNFDFVRLRGLAFGLTLLLSVLAVGLTVYKGLNFGVDFEGGLMIEERFAASPDLDRVRAVVDAQGVGEASLQQFGDPRTITIRLPAKFSKTLEQYDQDGFFDEILEQHQSLSDHDQELMELRRSRNYAEFFRKAVQYHKNIVVAGATGSGKTTFMKSLVNHIPDQERLVTIEDARELFIRQPNVVHLLYSKGGQSASNITAKNCMEACLRMKPDRIILAELRGDESFYFIRNCASGHPGSITSCHAGSTAQTWDQLALMVKASTEGAGLEFEVIKRLLKMTIDIVVHIKAHAGRRYITGIDFDPARALAS